MGWDQFNPNISTGSLMISVRTLSSALFGTEAIHWNAYLKRYSFYSERNVHSLLLYSGLCAKFWVHLQHFWALSFLSLSLTNMFHEPLSLTHQVFSLVLFSRWCLFHRTQTPTRFRQICSRVQASSFYINTTTWNRLLFILILAPNSCIWHCAPPSNSIVPLWNSFQRLRQLYDNKMITIFAGADDGVLDDSVEDENLMHPQ